MNNETTTPVVGMPATICHWTDRDPATVTYVSGGGKLLRVRTDSYTVVAGSESDGSAKYEYSENPAGKELTFRRTKAGNWRSPNGTVLALGNRRRYYDPHF